MGLNKLNILGYFMLSRHHEQPKQTLDVTQIVINLVFKLLRSRPSVLGKRRKESIEMSSTENWSVSIGPKTIKILYIHMNPEMFW
jgi:hypothetical protein